MTLLLEDWVQIAEAGTGMENNIAMGVDTHNQRVTIDMTSVHAQTSQHRASRITSVPSLQHNM